MEMIQYKICSNCKQTYIEGDKYCRFCGAPMGKPDFINIEEDFQCIYGPEPMKRIHTCTNCGHTWETEKMIDDERWCPECGGSVLIENIESDYLEEGISGYYQ